MGYRLRIVAGPGLGSEVALDEPEITIGRAPENGLVINDNNVSRVHARLTVGDRIVVIDNGSRNGVYVNDRKVNQQPIAPGDRLVIGQTVLELVADTPRRAAAPVARPGTGRVAAPANGRGGAVAVVKGPPPPATRGNQQMQRTGAVKTAPPRPGAAKPQAGGLPKLGILAIGAVVAIFVVFALVGGGGGKKNNVASGGGDLPRTTATPPIIPGLTGAPVVDSSSVAKCSKKAQEYMDLGDSTRDSNNLKASRDAFKAALKVDPSCLSASVRLKAVVDKIETKVIEYEKAGQQSYDSGDFARAIDMWEIAIEFIGDPKDPRTATLKTRIEQSRKLIQRQPQ